MPVRCVLHVQLTGDARARARLIATCRRPSRSAAPTQSPGTNMPILLWLLGVPIPIILLLLLFFH